MTQNTSQSAFAGYGLEVIWTFNKGEFETRSQSAFAGYGLEEAGYKIEVNYSQGRNPLSLDMGWKTK